MRASAVSRPTRVARMTNVPVVLRVAPMTSSPGPLPAGIGSPVSMPRRPPTLPRPRRRRPAPCRRAGRAAGRRRRPLRAGRPPRARRGRGAPSRAGARRAGGWRRSCWPLARASSQRPSRTRPMMIVDAVEVGPGSSPASSTTTGTSVTTTLYAQAARRADRDERVHVAGAVAGGPPGRAVEAAAGPDLDERRRARARAG